MDLTISATIIVQGFCMYDCGGPSYATVHLIVGRVLLVYQYLHFHVFTSGKVCKCHVHVNLLVWERRCKQPLDFISCNGTLTSNYRDFQFEYSLVYKLCCPQWVIIFIDWFLSPKDILRVTWCLLNSDREWIKCSCHTVIMAVFFIFNPMTRCNGCMNFTVVGQKLILFM